VDFRQVFGRESHQVDGLSRTKHWALGAIIAALCSFAYAKAPGMPHGGGAYSRGYSHAGADGSMHGMMGKNGQYGAPAAMSPRSLAQHNSRTPRGGSTHYASSQYADGFGAFNPGIRRGAGPLGYTDDGRGHMQYAGAITPVSAESRSVPRPPPNAPMRTGSIRADVARYNEERGSSRSMQRPVDDPRQPEGSPYRN
jgi:hypothetical protein